MADFVNWWSLLVPLMQCAAALFIPLLNRGEKGIHVDVNDFPDGLHRMCQPATVSVQDYYQDYYIGGQEASNFFSRLKLNH